MSQRFPTFIGKFITDPAGPVVARRLRRGLWRARRKVLPFEHQDSWRALWSECIYLFGEYPGGNRARRRAYMSRVRRSL